MALVQIRKQRKVELLRQVDLFTSCSTKELGQIASLVTEFDVEPGAVLIRRGDVGQDFFIIVEGRATADRKGVEIAQLGPGSFFGELALLDGGPRTATVVARSAMLLLVLTRREFASLLTSVPPVARKVIAELGARLRMTDEMLDATPGLGQRLRTWSL